MPKLRTILEAIKEIKQDDPKTALKPHALRQLIITNKVPSVKCGCKYLVDIDTLTEYLKGGLTPQPISTGAIRPINERQGCRV